MNALSRFERFDDMFLDLFRRFVPTSAIAGDVLGDLRLDIKERDNHYLVRAELPGVKKEDVRVEIDGNQVSIFAEARKDFEDQEDAKSGRTILRETCHGSLSRSLTLAHEIDRAGSSAKLEDGVLTMTLPKRESSGARQITIE